MLTKRNETNGNRSWYFVAIDTVGICCEERTEVAESDSTPGPRDPGRGDAVWASPGEGEKDKPAMKGKTLQ